MKITMDLLKELPPHTIFAAGTFLDATDRINITGEPGKLLRWVAVRGGIPDWAVYVGPAAWSFEKVAEQGDKILGSTAQILVDCTNETAKRYRY